MKINIESIGLRSIKVQIINTTSKQVEIHEILITKPTPKPFLMFILLIALLTLFSLILPVQVVMALTLIIFSSFSAISSKIAGKGKVLRTYPVRIMLRPNDILNLSIPISEEAKYIVIKSSIGTYTKALGKELKKYKGKPVGKYSYAVSR